MNTLQLYLNDQLVDLADDSPIALTFQINNLAEVKNQQGNTSNQFKLPLTQRNRRILGFPDELAFTDDNPYKQYAAKMIQDGLEILPYGIAELNGIDQDTAAVTVLSGNVDFFDAIDGKIYDLGNSATTLGKLKLMEPYTHTWTLQNVVVSQTKTEGWIWPVIDYGKIPESFEGSPQIDIRYLRPGFFLKTAINLMVASTGYQIDPTCFLLNDTLYPKLIVQFANDAFDHSTDTQNGNDGYSVELSNSQNQPFSKNTVNDNNTGVMEFRTVVNDNHQAFHSPDTYVVPARLNVSINLTFGLVINGLIGSNNKSQITIGLRIGDGHGGFTDVVSTAYNLDDNPTVLAGNIGTKEFKDQKMSYDTELAAGQTVVVFYVLQNKNRTTGTIYSGAKLSIKSKSEQVLFGQNVQCERIFPDISMKDLLKDTLQRFGIICQTNNITRQVNFASFRNIVNNIPLAKNWTRKCLNQGKSISFQLGGYAQVNYMKYKTDDGIQPPTFGQSQLNVADKTLPATADLFESQFAPTLNRAYIGGSIAQIKKIEDDGTDFSISTQPRILMDEKLALSGRSVVFTDGETLVTVNDIICTPYFDKPGGKHSLTFDALRQAYYPELEKILAQTKKVVRYFMLTPRDILEIDLLIPVYLEQDSAYYYINKIDSWRKGQPTKVELVKLS